MTKRVAVIGAGVVGLATARMLERHGCVCSVFEQGAPGGGQSSGESRIFRHVHADQRQFELALRARRLWREWEVEFGVQLISPDGSLAIGERAVSRMSGYADEPAIQVRELDAKGVSQALPALTGFEGPAMIDEAAGAIRTRLTLAHLIAAAGANLVPERVDAVLPRPAGGVDLFAASSVDTFDAAVICAGTGTATLADRAGVAIPLGIEAHVRLTLDVSAGFLPRLACLHDLSTVFGEPGAYGSPIRGNRQYSVGLPVNTSFRRESPPDRLTELAARTTGYVRRALPGLDLSSAVPLHCWVTELPWARDGLAIWQSGDAFFVAGHNLFKLAPVISEALARSVGAGEVKAGFRPEDRLGEPVGETTDYKG